MAERCSVLRANHQVASPVIPVRLSFVNENQRLAGERVMKGPSSHLELISLVFNQRMSNIQVSVCVDRGLISETRSPIPNQTA